MNAFGIFDPGLVVNDVPIHGSVALHDVEVGAVNDAVPARGGLGRLAFADPAVAEDPRVIVEVRDVHDQGIALPATPRIAHRQPYARIQMRPAVERNDARHVVPLVDDGDEPGRLQDLIGIVVDRRVGPRHARLQAAHARIEKLRLVLLLVNLFALRDDPRLHGNLAIRRVDDHRRARWLDVRDCGVVVDRIPCAKIGRPNGLAAFGSRGTPRSADRGFRRLAEISRLVHPDMSGWPSGVRGGTYGLAAGGFALLAADALAGAPVVGV